MKAQPIAASSEGMPLPQNTISIAQMPVSSETMPTADGIYLYGEAPASDRIGTAYMVFELRQSQAVGAFFMPHSSFDCFYGRVSPRALEVTVVNSYDRTAYDYAVALEDSAIASEANVTIEPEFEGFYPIESLSDSNRQILETCKDRYQNAVWQ
ncbi:MAG: hypothetical protein J7641_13410 [Cyanobacteria bacterium SID2]|nr:hypothetical protein [Cyanobacteria bacterium SID2]MBP0006612.1 hypothetical protein [Cyanobacteria bacterium SBC]